MSVRIHRQRLGLSQEDLARRAGVDEKTVRNIEAGRSTPRPSTVRQLAEALALAGTDRERFCASAASDVVDDPAQCAPAVVVPAQLPPDVSAFIGRSAELDQLDDLLTPAGRALPAVVISALSGTAGVGKTALALRWAHRVANRFPDGQLYVDLRGYDPDLPLSAGDALAGFLRELGVAGAEIPLDLADRAARYRTLLAGRRILVILDNASTVEQVRPLLPGNPSCPVVVTSRDSLAGLVARHGACRIELDLLPLTEAVALLRALIGDRVDAEPDAAMELARQCVRLPLALRVAAEFAARRSTVPLAHLVKELTDHQHRLELLDAGGDPRTAVRAVFSWSYDNLPLTAARAFRLLGLHPGADFDEHAAAAMTASTVEQARQMLDVLTRAHLVRATGTGRHGMHDLLRAYAADVAAAVDREDSRRAALTRLFDHYLATAAAAMDVLYPAEKHRRPLPPAGRPASPPLADPATALAWLDTEQANLVAASAYTASHGLPGHTIRIANTVFRYLDVGGHHPAAVAVHRLARQAARQSNDPTAEAHALTSLGVAYGQQSLYREAAECFQQVLVLFSRADDRVGQARVAGNLGLVEERQGHYEQAAEYFRQALTLYRAMGDRVGEGMALDNLGDLAMRQGRYHEASDHQRQALALCRATGDQIGEASALQNLGLIEERRGRYEQAAEYHRQALEINRESGHRVGEGCALTYLGVVSTRLGRFAEAAEQHRQAVALLRETGHRSSEAEALNGLGEALHLLGRPSDAQAEYTAGLALSVETGDRRVEAQAHAGLARTHQATGRRDLARRHWQQALAIYTNLAMPEADEVRAELVALDRSAPGVTG